MKAALRAALPAAVGLVVILSAVGQRPRTEPGQLRIAHVFKVTWPRDPDDVFSEPCCGDLFHCATRSATRTECGDRRCDPLRRQLPGCPDASCTRFGFLCDGTDDCADGADEAYCGEIIATFSEIAVQAPIRSQLAVYGLSLQACAAYCFFRAERCSEFTFSDDFSMSGHVVPPGRPLNHSRCQIGCSDCSTIVQPVGPVRWFVSDQARTATLRRGAFNPALPATCGRVADTPGATRYPWQARIKRAAGGGHHCGGVIVSERVVLTAAHCLTDSVDSYEVVVGDYDIGRSDPWQQTFTIQNMLVPPGYSRDSGTKVADLAILMLNTHIRAMQFSSEVEPACLTRPSLPPPDPHATCVISGWGSTQAGGGGSPARVLRGGRIPLASDAACALREPLFRRGAMLCAGTPRAGDIDACGGDSGGGLVCRHDATGRWHLAGVVSFGSAVCGQRGRLAVFTKVRAYFDWIVDSV